MIRHPVPFPPAARGSAGLQGRALAGLGIFLCSAGLAVAQGPVAASARPDLIDVTAAPYRADPTGVADATKAIQKAADDARDQGKVCFFPPGTYLVSDTISCETKAEKLDKPRHVDGGTQHYWPVQRPIVLLGSTRGKRPVLKLSPKAAGFDDPSRPKYLVWIWTQTWFDAPGKEEPVWGKPMLEIVDSRDVLAAQVKAFSAGAFPHIVESFGGVRAEVPSSRACALFVRSGDAGSAERGTK